MKQTIDNDALKSSQKTPTWAVVVAIAVVLLFLWKAAGAIFFGSEVSSAKTVEQPVATSWIVSGEFVRKGEGLEVVLDRIGEPELKEVLEEGETGFDRVSHTYGSRAIVYDCSRSEEFWAQGLSDSCLLDDVIVHREEEVEARKEEFNERRIERERREQKAREEELEQQRLERERRERDRWEPFIQKRQVAIGMPPEAVIRSWGRPDDVNKTIFSGGSREQWVYERADYQSQYVYFDCEGDRCAVTTIQSW